MSLLLLLAADAKAAPVPFLVASNAVSMCAASDGSNYLFGVEDHQGVRPTIAAQMVSATGVKVGGIIPTGRSGIATAMAFDGTNYLLIWEDDGLGSLTSTTGWAIYGQFISKAGALVGTPFPITTTGIWFDGIKTMAFGGGKYLVTYTRLIDPALGGQSYNRYIAGTIVNPDGSKGSEFRISTGHGKASEVAFDGTNFFVVWCEDIYDVEIQGRFVSTTGQPGTEISVDSSVAPSDNPKSVAFDGENYFVVWNDEVSGKDTGTWDCFGRLVSRTGTLVGERVPLTTDPGPQMVTGVAFDGAAYMAVWSDMINETNWNMYAQYVNRSGSLIGGRQTVSEGLGNELGGVGFVNGTYVLVINNGVQLGEGGIGAAESATAMFLDPLRPVIQANADTFGIRTNRFGFDLSGIPGMQVVIQARTNAGTGAWVPVATNTLSGGTSYFSDPNWATYPTRVYRAVVP